MYINPKDIIYIKNIEDLEINMNIKVDFSELIGKTLKKITVENDHYKYSNIIFECDDCSVYVMFHHEDCCERVYIEDIDGDIQDLIGEVILNAEEILGESGDGYLWTFYKIATNKNSITIRWYGEDEGYYSLGVSFEKIKKDN